MKILIIGGTRFAGKSCLLQAVEAGHDVTVVSRGRTPLPSDRVQRHIICDRRDLHQHLSKDDRWDAVIDNVCFEASEANHILDLLDGRCSRYVVTSSLSVYEMHAPCHEADFDPVMHQWTEEADKFTDYAEAKRQVEQVVAARATMPWAAVRFPFIVGPDDYSKRFDWHVDRIKQDAEIYVPDIDVRISMIHQDDAGRTLLRLAEGALDGPVNSGAPPVTIREVLDAAAHIARAPYKLASDPTDENQSPYAPPEDWYPDSSRLASVGCTWELDLGSWARP